MEKNIFLTLILVLIGCSLPAQIATLEWFTSENPSVFYDDDINVTCGVDAPLRGFRLHYDHCPDTDDNCAGGCLLSPNPYKLIVTLVKDFTIIDTKEAITSNESGNIFFYDIPISPGTYYASVKFEKRTGLFCTNWELIYGNFSDNGIDVFAVPPTPAFSAPSSTCIGQNIQVNAATTLNTVSHDWFYYPSSGSPGNSLCNTPTCNITANTAGDYIIKHVLYAPCDTVEELQNFTVYAQPNVSISNATFCETENNGVLSYSPSGGQMLGTGVVNNGGFWRFDASAAGPGSHNIFYSYVDANGCSNIDNAWITVDAEITNINFSHAPNICENNNNIFLAANPTGGTWAGPGVIFAFGDWYFDPTGLTGSNTLTYSVSSINGTCSTSQQTSITVDDPVTFAPTIPWPDVCIGDSAIFIANPNNDFSNNVSINWDFGPNASPDTSINNSVKVVFNQAGTANVILEGENECGLSQQNYSVLVNAPFTGLQITNPNPFCGATNLTSNYTGPDPISWSGNGVSYNGQIGNASAPLAAASISLTIQNACQVSTDSIFLHYRKEEISPVEFCIYDNPIQLNADIAPGSWAAAPNTQYPNSLASGALNSGGNFDPSVAGPGEFRVVHQSVCNKAGVLKILPGDPQSTSEWPKHFNDFGAGEESGRDVVKTPSDAYYITGTFSGTMEIDPNGPTLVSNSGSTDIFVAKYDDCGVVWAQAFGSSGDDHSPAIAWDMSNLEEAIYISGTIAGNTIIPGNCASCNLFTSASSKGFIAKFDADGEGVWASIPISSNTELNSFKDIDAAGGQVVLTGDYLGSISLNGSTEFAIGGASDEDILVISLLDLGTSPVNMQLLTRGSQSNDSGNGIAIDWSNQNIIVTGYASPADLEANYLPQNPGGKDVFLGLINQSFHWEWINLYGGPDDDEGTGIAAGNEIVIAGFMEGIVDLGGGLIQQTNDQSVDAFIMNVQLNGFTSWQHLGGSIYDLDRGVDVAISGANVAMIGNFSGTSTIGNLGPISSLGSNDQDVFLAIFDLANGNPINYTSIKGSGPDQGHAISAAPNDATYFFTGDFQDNLDLIPSLTASFSTTDMFAARYDPLSANLFFKTKQEQADTDLETEDLTTSIKAFPNPTNSYLQIEISQAMESELKIFDLTGKLLEHITDIPAGNFQTEVDFSKYPAGIYLIRCGNAKQEVQSLRVLKQ